MIPPIELPLERMRALAHDPEFQEAMVDLYAGLDSEVSSHRPVCCNRGVCCRFGEFGHRLYVTPAELAYFAGSVGRAPPVAASPDSCPYQVGGLCEARGPRPMGCRVFFCESAGQGWQEDLTENYLRRLRSLHERFHLPYAYGEWLAGLGQTVGAFE
jgi:hypothetical protein